MATCEPGIYVPIPGPPGPPGPAGPPGPPGDGGGYLHTQTTPASNWTIPHGLNRPIVGALVYSLDLSIQYSNVFVEHLSPDTCRLWVSPALTGIARIY